MLCGNIRYVYNKETKIFVTFFEKLALTVNNTLNHLFDKRSLYHGYTVVIQLLYGSYTIVLRSFCGCSAVVLR
jgi:hypothetical protein